jgi:hypothetical protein
MTDTAWEHLAAVLTEENDALERLDLGRAAGIVAAKEAALAAIATAAPPPQRQLASLGDLARDNRRLLEHAIATQARVLELVATAARAAMASETPAPGYSGLVLRDATAMVPPWSGQAMVFSRSV